MPLVILQPCGNQDAREHYKDTIENSVQIDDIKDLISEEQIIRLNEIYPDGKLKIWAVVCSKLSLLKFLTKYKNHD